MEKFTREEVEHILSSIYSKAEYDVLFKEASKNQVFFNLLWEIVKEKKESESWRIVWILDHATEKKNDFILPILDEIYERILKSKHEGFIRLSMKLILRCPVNEDFAGELLDRCIGWMNDPKLNISSQVLGLEFFYKVCQLYPEMSPELLAYINEMMERSPSAGMKVRLKQIRSQLDRKRFALKNKPSG